MKSKRLHPQIVEIIDPWLSLENGNRVFTSLEGENPGGSMKDYMVKGEIENLLQQNILRPGGGLAEVSAGSTAAALAHYCPLYGLQCVLFVPTTASLPLRQNLQNQGAELHVEELSSIYDIYDQFIVQRPELHRFDQLFDMSKRRYYHSFGSEILHSLGKVDLVIGSVGTGHSLLGTADGLGRPPIFSAEPAPPLKIPGVRNVETDRYGAKDTCQSQDFHQRVLVAEPDLARAQEILTSAGPVQISASFQLVLSALKTVLADKRNLQVFAVGANLKRVMASQQKQAA